MRADLRQKDCMMERHGGKYHCISTQHKTGANMNEKNTTVAVTWLHFI